MVATAVEWTKPYYGVQHSSSGSSRRFPYCTVCAYPGFAELHCYYLGCAFSPLVRNCADAAAARTLGETWLQTGVLPAAS